MYKKLYLAGLGVYAVLIVLAGLYYMERIVFSDGAFAMFHLVKDGAPVVQIFRFGDAISQLVPLLAYQMHGSLSSITLCYSLGLLLVHVGSYVVAGSILKQHRLALVILLVNVLFAAHSFYWPIAQAPQGIALIVVLLAVLWNKTIGTMRLPEVLVCMLLLITIVFFHPLMALCFGYVVLFFLLRQGAGPGKKLLYSASILFVTIFIIKMIFFRVSYERHSLSGLKNFITLFPNYFNTYTNIKLLTDLLTIYYWIPVVLALCVGVSWRRKEYMKGGVTILGTVGYIMLVNTCYPENNTPPAYLEALYLPVALFLALPFVYDVLPTIQKNYATGLMILIMGTGCYRIYATHAPYTKRLNWQREFVNKYGHRKMIVGSSKTDVATLQMLWGTPYEFWLLSTVENGYSASIIIDDTPAKRSWAAGKTKALIVNWNDFAYDALDKRYFLLRDTTTGYEIDPELR